MKAFFSIILAVAVSISTALAKHGGQRGHGGYHGKHGKHFSSVSPRGGYKFSRGNRENTATGAVETGEGVIGAAIGGVAVIGAAAADSSLSAEVIRTTGIGTHIGAGAILTRTPTTAIILRIGTLTTVAPYQDSDSLGLDSSWFSAPASPGHIAPQRLKATIAV
jgi:hypothetical protein